MNKVVTMTCIMCPMGCSLSVEKEKGGLKVNGNTCIRGEQYAKEELTEPKRIVTALVKTKDGVLPVKTNKPVPKQLMFDVVKEINKLHISKGKIGDIIIKNVLNTGADIVITGNKVDYNLN